MLPEYFIWNSYVLWGWEDVFSVDCSVSSTLYIGMVEQIISTWVFYPERETWNYPVMAETILSPWCFWLQVIKKNLKWLKQQRGLADACNIRISEEGGSFRYGLIRAWVILLSFASAHMVTLFKLENICLLGRHHPSMAWRVEYGLCEERT